ncbi:hypothetical protein Y032_0076g1008 [Ancylostoma ceylanicum]|uniref:Major intrinsic protein n=1 Tax=Ancylostoma ceylanicum TaxID=53326 RepID=A0A016TUA4_9BILA|nr:hypothetical protein Y032_0076g1008 [Ancylostoma ceylanicum]
MSDVSITGVDVYRFYVLPALGELIGTCLFTLFVNLAGSQSAVRTISYPVMSGISLFVLRGFFSKITPGHYNPAVSISQLVMRRIDAPTAVTYVFVQGFGAFLGAVLFRALVSNAIFVDYFIGSYITTEGSIARSQTLVSYFSLPLIGQSGNVALSSANAIVHHIFTGDGSSTGHLYLHFSASLIAVVLSSFVLWLLNSPMARKELNERSKPEVQSKLSGTF